MAREQQLRQSLILEDRAAVAEMLLRDFVAVWPDGTVVDRQGQLEMLGAEITIERIDVEDVKLRVYRDTAVVTGLWNIEAVWRGNHIKAPRRFSHTWVKTAGEWMLLSRHLTEMPPKASR